MLGGWMEKGFEVSEKVDCWISQITNQTLSRRFLLGFEVDMKPISVLLVDDDPTFLDILNRLLWEHHNDGVTVVGLAALSDKTVAKALKLQPKVILLDLGLAGLRGVPYITLSA